MRKKTQDIERSDRAGPGTDTSTFDQAQGQDRGSTAGRRAEKLPHERDESARDTGNRLDEPIPPSDRQISQAYEDIERGLKDTDRRGIPDDVPGSRRNRER